MNCIIVTDKNRYVSHLYITTRNSTHVVVCKKDKIYSPSDITAKPYYLKRNYQDLQMFKNSGLLLQCNSLRMHLYDHHLALVQWYTSTTNVE